MSLGERIRMLRIEAEMSQQQLADILSVSRQAITKWESDRGIPDINNLTALSEVFYISVDEMLQPENIGSCWKPSLESEYIHIAVGDSFSGTLKQALVQLALDTVQKLITMRQDYAIGPILDLDSVEGQKVRKHWFFDNITGALDERAGLELDEHDLPSQFALIPKRAKIVIWTGSNAMEQTGLQYAVHLLQHKDNTIRICDASAVSKRLHQGSKFELGYSGYVMVNEVCEMLKQIEKYSTRLDTEAILNIEKSWQRISKTEEVLRIWQNEEVIPVAAGYYDECLLDSLRKLEPYSDNKDGYIKAAALIGEVTGKCGQYISDAFLEYRLRELIYAGILEIKGVPAAMRYYSVRRKG